MCDHASETEAAELGEVVFVVFDIEGSEKAIPVLVNGNASEYKETCTVTVEPLTAGFFEHQNGGTKKMKSEA